MEHPRVYIIIGITEIFFEILAEEGNSDWEIFKLNTGVGISNKKGMDLFLPYFYTYPGPSIFYVDFTG